MDLSACVSLQPESKYSMPYRFKNGQTLARQCAALAIKQEDGETLVMLVTSRDTGRWVLPKGWAEKRLTGAKLSEKEAYEEAGIVGRVRCQDDRRRVLVHLTEDGSKLLDAKRQGWSKRWEDAMADVSQSDLDAAADVMRRIAAMLDEL